MKPIPAGREREVWYGSSDRWKKRKREEQREIGATSVATAVLDTVVISVGGF